MPWLRHFALFLVFVAALFRPAAAGAFSTAPDAGSPARVGAFELVAASLVGPATAATCRLHEGIGAAYDENASGYRFAAGGGRITDPSRLLPERAGPTGHISPSEVAGRTPAQIDARARELGLTPRGADPAGGRGAYIDPQTGQQRILSHPNASPPHGHVNNPAGQRIDINGNVVPPESPAAHLPLGGG
jgi:hypothetical protein